MNDCTTNFNKEEIKLIQELFNNSELKGIDEDTKEALLKIGMTLPVTNRGGKGKNIIKILSSK